MADAFPLNPGSIVVIDRGYNDYALFGKWTGAGIHFVTRLKDHTATNCWQKACFRQTVLSVPTR